MFLANSIARLRLVKGRRIPNTVLNQTPLWNVRNNAKSIFVHSFQYWTRKLLFCVCSSKCDKKMSDSLSVYYTNVPTYFNFQELTRNSCRSAISIEIDEYVWRADKSDILFHVDIKSAIHRVWLCTDAWKAEPSILIHPSLTRLSAR